MISNTVKSITRQLQKQGNKYCFSSTQYRESFIPVHVDNPFPIQNIPFGVFQHKNVEGQRIAVAIGDSLVDIHNLVQQGLFADFPLHVQKSLKQQTLNDFLGLSKSERNQVRTHIQSLLAKDSATQSQIEQSKSIYSQNDVSLVLPMNVGDYTDFYASRQHAENLGELFRPGGDKLFPNWLHMPIAYHGRASSINIDKEVKRPIGQTELGQLTPEKRLDIELEMALIIGGKTNKRGERVSVQNSEENIAGFTLMNDFSSRMVQRVEYQPLGPFLGKNFSTTLSPWVVLPEALENFKQKITPQPDILPYLTSDNLSLYDIPLEVHLKPSGSSKKQLISQSNMKNLYWTFEQMIAHHSVGGCNLQSGDVFGSGTISGNNPQENGGSMLEICWAGKKPIQLEDGVERCFLQDGDTVYLSGGARLPCGQFIGFGETASTILPADEI